MKTIVFLIIGLAYYYYRGTIKNKIKSRINLSNEFFPQKTPTQSIRHSGVDQILDKNEYRRFILLKGNSSENIKSLLQLYHEYNNLPRKPIRMAEKHEWKVLLVDEGLSNAEYYNLVLWLGEELKRTREKINCYGFALNRKRKELNIIFHPENIGYNSTLIGSFESGQTFFVNETTTPGTISMTQNIPVDFKLLLEELDYNGFDVSSIFYLHYDKFYIGKDSQKE